MIIGYEQAKKCFHLAYGQVVGPTGKMSSREGTVIYFSHLEQQLVFRLFIAVVDSDPASG